MLPTNRYRPAINLSGQQADLEAGFWPKTPLLSGSLRIYCAILNALPSLSQNLKCILLCLLWYFGIHLVLMCHICCGLICFGFKIFFNHFNFYFPLCQIHYHTLKQRKIKIKPQHTCTCIQNNNYLSHRMWAADQWKQNKRWAASYWADSHTGCRLKYKTMTWVWATRPLKMVGPQAKHPGLPDHVCS